MEANLFLVLLNKENYRTISRSLLDLNMYMALFRHNVDTSIL